MLYDRPYIRQNAYRTELPVLKWLLLANLGVFVLQCILERWFGKIFYYEYFALTGYGFKSGYLWTPLSYSFLHSTQQLLHIVGNMLFLNLFGRALQSTMGGQKLLALYLGSAIFGGLFWLLFNFQSGHVIGASGAVLGFLAVYCLMHPNQHITFLLFFIIPVTLKPKYVGWATVLINLFGFLFYELPPGGSGSGIAYSAHLGGLMFAWVFFRYLLYGKPIFGEKSAIVDIPRWFSKKSANPSPDRKFTINITNRKQLKGEVDRILDKINSNGFGSLSDEEKRTLDRAKDILSR